MQTELFKPVATANILVVGDIILDQYIYGETSRISPEAPVPVVRVSSTKERPGGAANVAVNCSSLGVQVQLLGITGNDAAADRLAKLLLAESVDCHFLKQDALSTITKQRVLSQHQQLLRLDYENTRQQLELAELLATYSNLVESVNLIILSDYAKGSLARITTMIDIANQHHIPVLVDPKSDDFSAYKNATVITPNLKEFEAVVGPCHTTEELVAKAQKLNKELNLTALLVTRGEKGMTLIHQDGSFVHLQAQAHEVFDVTGAGDTVIATLATAIACDYGLEQAINFANTAAGLVVEKLGAATVTADEINSTSDGQSASGVMHEDQAVAWRNKSRKAGERVVMTNGCFDILHMGHINYLRAAKARGDRLLVAVNSDASVRGLKGATRPINKLEDRMNLLEALSFVDAVVPFDESTPENLINKIQPDMLVKGGDYTEAQIAGAEFVKQAGGEVIILPFHAGYSTTSILAAADNNEAKSS